MQVKDLLEIKGKSVYTIESTEPLNKAMEKMITNNVGSLLVVDQKKRVLGIFTERDLLKKCVYEGKDAHQEIIEDHYTRQLLIIRPDEELSHAMEAMTKNRVRHLPVVQGESLEGIISIGDVVKAQLDEYSSENTYLKDYIVTKYPG